ncbi:sialidase family protein [Roseicyclus sp. F158]|uniref:Sialidase family protein n=1 Tax=Tropicimonas omnivorans TaxID=3075590 RepID=A0ABU3DKI7_9RHOB|nr:sialidase family protein [Roseicyclus sp. F158]MDT0684228.1 sialidase family protein [Roseicyclus sp. F158]
MTSVARTMTAAAAICALGAGAALAQDMPFDVADGLFEFEDTDTLGLEPAEGAETITVFEPGDEDWKFNHGSVLIGFGDELYMQWQSSEMDEDATETVVVYSRSADGETWSEPVQLTAPWNEGYTSNGGWWTDGETLVAYLNVWPDAVSPRGGHVEYMTSTDGRTWSKPQPVTMADGTPLEGIFEQDPTALESGRIVNSAHLQPGLTAKPIFTDDPLGVSGWTVGEMENLPHEGDITRELEPSWFVQEDGDVVMIFRDQGNTFLKLASLSSDEGETWSLPVETEMPDSRTKQSAGNLPDGTAYMAGNPTGTKARMPLAVVTSADGELFDEAYLLRSASDMQDLRYEGQYKRPSYSYTKSYVWNDDLYVAYATNKEDVQFTRVPLDTIARGADAD